MKNTMTMKQLRRIVMEAMKAEKKPIYEIDLDSLKTKNDLINLAKTLKDAPTQLAEILKSKRKTEELLEQIASLNIDRITPDAWDERRSAKFYSARARDFEKNTKFIDDTTKAAADLLGVFPRGTKLYFSSAAKNGGRVGNILERKLKTISQDDQVDYLLGLIKDEAAVKEFPSLSKMAQSVMDLRASLLEEAKAAGIPLPETGEKLTWSASMYDKINGKFQRVNEGLGSWLMNKMRKFSDWFIGLFRPKAEMEFSKIESGIRDFQSIVKGIERACEKFDNADDAIMLQESRRRALRARRAIRARR